MVDLGMKWLQWTMFQIGKQGTCLKVAYFTTPCAKWNGHDKLYRCPVATGCMNLMILCLTGKSEILCRKGCINCCNEDHVMFQGYMTPLWYMVHDDLHKAEQRHVLKSIFFAPKLLIFIFLFNLEKIVLLVLDGPRTECRFHPQPQSPLCNFWQNGGRFVSSICTIYQSRSQVGLFHKSQSPK